MEGLPTKNNLRLRNIILSNSQLICPLCEFDLETEVHLFCWCKVTDSLWKRWWRTFQCPVVPPNSLGNLYLMKPV
ncbi:hypothetical protein Fmac_019126 [Flemingia macrophylla]|uniref:Reverse transcriptase zinc-binding domain-containing protein n=1 Tax=Flemingia macrophylla TaxID=520843 RepID=A0ABD1M6V7_9FABA